MSVTLPAFPASLLTVLVAALLGALIGAEREWRRHPGGLRSCALVAAAAAVFAQIAVAHGGGSAGAALGAIATGLAALIGPGHHFLLMSFLPIPAIIGGFIGAIVTGFVFHPVMTWIITKLKGESDARSRTNYFLQTMTLSILLAVPNAIGLILGALPIPFIKILFSGTESMIN